MNDVYTFELCKQVCDARSMTEVASTIGYSRTAVSLYLSGKYGAGVDKLEAAIRKHYAVRYPCEHTEIEISGADCQRRATAPRPFGGRARGAHWLACQSCKYNLSDRNGEPS
ncbi:MAG: helix-turn-helix transcriptional regulator [Sulfurimicrobium sp.]|nr:helix-turn-helix transcriptional regulator [Gallionella sp.]MDP1898303.1 helix-turn-helix transcriptional regulator [Sulfurimicrobium sp.]